MMVGAQHRVGGGRDRPPVRDLDDMLGIGAQGRYRPVVESAVARIERPVAFQDQVADVVAGGFMEGGRRTLHGKRSRGAVRRERLILHTDQLFEWRSQAIAQDGSQHPYSDDDQRESVNESSNHRVRLCRVGGSAVTRLANGLVHHFRLSARMM